MSGINYIKRIDGALNSIVQINTSDSSATATAANYITAQAANIAAINSSEVSDPFDWLVGDLVILLASDGTSLCTINSTFTSLSPYVSLAPTDQVVTINNATPGTIRAGTFNLVQQATTMTSGNIVGVRGAVNMVGASGGFVYGGQGKVISTGTLSGSVWVAGLFGQLDLSAATINSGQVAALWGDWGATGAVQTNMSGTSGIKFTNTTADKLNEQINTYGDATYYLNIRGNPGPLSYYLAAGTSGGSAGDSSHCAAQQVLKIIVQGSAAYIPVFTQNS